MVLFRDQSARGSHNLKTDNSSFERVEEFKYLATTSRSQDSIQELSTDRLRSGNACCQPVHKILPSSLLSSNLKIKIYENIIFPLVLYGCKTWSLTWREERRLLVFENRVLRRIQGPKRDDVTGEWRKIRNEELNDLNLTTY